MRVSLINLGDGDRCLFDIRSRAVTVGVGEIVDADLSDSTVNTIRRFHRTDTLLVGPQGSIDPPVKLKSALEILKNIDYEPYDRLLGKYWKIVPRMDGGSRPTRMTIRKACRGIIEAHLNREAAPEVKDESSEDESEAEPVDQRPTKSENSARLSGRRRSRR